ncbi:hypothetical protein [Aquabacterium sp.]|uniref:hypothetical protein n=1 Tax=Aquabacterium sp. TaxID=1872578 RepID=UPI003782FB51
MAALSVETTIMATTDTLPTPCPMRALHALQPQDELALPQHRRMVVQYLDDEDRRPVLHLFYDDKDIAFDEPDLFPFGEALARQERFRASEALDWCAGQDWPRLASLLATLLDEGVLVHADALGAEAARALDRPAPLPPGPNPRPREWSDCDALMRELTGRALEPGWLELVVPVFRVAHMALDAEGRQVGEANVFPPALRMDVPTRWRTCIYPGTRHQSPRPMNVTALKAMRTHWPQMMLALRAVREAYLRRFPEARTGWTVGHLERLATAVLALPTYLLQRAAAPVPNAALHPALSCLFRVTDGLRMVMHQMLFVPIGEPTLPPQAAMSRAEILAYAERNYAFHSEHGVCAGPQAMIDEFLAVLVDGAVPSGLAGTAVEPAVAQALAAVEPALDYALLGLQAYAVVFSLWPRMARAYAELLPLLADWAALAPTTVGPWHARLRTHVDAVRQATYLANEHWRADRERVYGDMHAQCARGLGQCPQPLAQRLGPPSAQRLQALQQALVPVLRQRFGPAAGAADLALRAVARRLARYLAEEQDLLALATEAQHRINAHLGRTQPQRPFDSADIDLHNQLQGAAARRLPDLVAELARELDCRLVVDAHGVHIGPATSPPPGSTPSRPFESAGTVPAAHRA